MDQAARVQVDQWTGWPGTKAAGGPVELGGLQPHRCYDLLFSNLVDMHGQAVRVQVIWRTRCTCYQVNRNYMIEHIYCMLILRMWCSVILDWPSWIWNFVSHMFHANAPFQVPQHILQI